MSGSGNTAGKIEKLGIKAVSYIPVMAQNGDNIVAPSKKMAWYRSRTVIEQIDSFRLTKTETEKSFRFPVQDIYKFTGAKDTRRILAGRVTSGRIMVGDQVFFSPSNKSSRVKSIEIFEKSNVTSIETGNNCGILIDDPLYIQPGEIMWKKGASDHPFTAQRFLATIFWMGNLPMVKNRTYMAKLGTAKFFIEIVSILNKIDASELKSLKGKVQINKNDVAECILSTNKPIALDPATAFDASGRFVIIDAYEISGAAIVIDKINNRCSKIQRPGKNSEIFWVAGRVPRKEREQRNSHKARFVLITGKDYKWSNEVAKRLETELFDKNISAYYLGVKDSSGKSQPRNSRRENIHHIGTLAGVLTSAGHIFISAINDLDYSEFSKLKHFIKKDDLLVISIGPGILNRLFVNLEFDEDLNPENITARIIDFLIKKSIFSREKIPLFR